MIVGDYYIISWATLSQENNNSYIVQVLKESGIKGVWTVKDKATIMGEETGDVWLLYPDNAKYTIFYIGKNLDDYVEYLL